MSGEDSKWRLPRGDYQHVPHDHSEGARERAHEGSGGSSCAGHPGRPHNEVCPRLLDDPATIGEWIAGLFLSWGDLMAHPRYWLRSSCVKKLWTFPRPSHGSPDLS